uniref:Uncharacterized protein n=1 Tax=Anopheles culicifacies TaxID=139723 RepID=A0A182MIR5_9DIPT
MSKQGRMVATGVDVLISGYREPCTNEGEEVSISMPCFRCICKLYLDASVYENALRPYVVQLCSRIPPAARASAGPNNSRRRNGEMISLPPRSWLDHVTNDRRSTKLSPAQLFHPDARVSRG